MIRYRNVTSGAIVNVRDDKVLDSQWEPYDGPASEPVEETSPAPRKPGRPRKSEQSE